MKLLCTLASLCEGSPLQPLRLDFFGSNFPLILAHNYHLSFLVDTVTEQVERCADPMIALLSPTLPPHRHCYPSHLPLIHRQGKLHAAPRHSASPRAAAGMFPLHLAKYFFRSLTVFFLYIFRNLSWSSHPLEEVTLKLKEGAVKCRRGGWRGKSLDDKGGGGGGGGGKGGDDYTMAEEYRTVCYSVPRMVPFLFPRRSW